MKIKNVQRKIKESKNVKMTIRTTPSNYKWMKKCNVSPQAIFDVAITDLKEDVKNKLRKAKNENLSMPNMQN